MHKISWATATATIVFCLSSLASAQVQTGIDILKDLNFDPLRGHRVGIITNQTGVDRDGRRTLDLIKQAPKVTVVAIFSPEHGLYGRKDEKVSDATDPVSGLHVYSLYGKTRRPTTQQLEDIDTLVFDIQDVGARFYTYSATLGLCMEEAGKHGLQFIVLDRPNPIARLGATGPIADKAHQGFTAYGPMPVTHGMTFGELARFYKDQWHVNCDLLVIKMAGWHRDMWWDQTGLQWVPPSPAMRTPTAALLYPGVCLMEHGNVSVGRGTQIPFECFGAPWVDEVKLAHALNDQNIPGLKFDPIRFTPSTAKYKNQSCGGVKITVTDREGVEPVNAGIAMAMTLRKLFPTAYDFKSIPFLLHNTDVFNKLADLKDSKDAPKLWEADLKKFQDQRAQELIYP